MIGWNDSIKKELKYCGENVFIANNVIFTNPSEVVLHDNVRIDPFCLITTKLEVGSYVQICSHTVLGGGKEQKITIQASGGLSDEEIDKMVQDAEENAESDKAKKDLVEAKNQAESLIHSTEKSIEEHGDKVDPSTIEAMELSMKALKEVLESDDAEKINARSQDLTEASMKLGEAIYKAEAEKNPTDPSTSDDNVDQNDGDIVDADFEDLDDQKK